MKCMQRLVISVILSAAIGMSLLPAVQASPIVRANPSSGTIYYFPAIPDYQDFSSNLTVTGTVSGTPTWSAAPASGSPSCAIYIHVSFGNANAWNTTAKFDDHSALSCQATINLTVSNPALVGSAAVNVTYIYCRNCL
jgi:hypothetical protein